MEAQRVLLNLLLHLPSSVSLAFVSLLGCNHNEVINYKQIITSEERLMMMMGPITVQGYCTKEYFGRVAKQFSHFVKHSWKFDFCAAARGDKRNSELLLF